MTKHKIQAIKTIKNDIASTWKEGRFRRGLTNFLTTPSWTKQKSIMLTLKEQIQNLETILQEQNLSPEVRQICQREIERLKRELITINRAK